MLVLSREAGSVLNLVKSDHIGVAIDSFSFHVIQQRFSRWIKPSTTSLLLGTFADVIRGKSELLAENALLRQQLIILRRQIKRPTYMSFILIHGAFLSDNLRILV